MWYHLVKGILILLGVVPHCYIGWYYIIETSKGYARPIGTAPLGGLVDEHTWQGNWFLPQVAAELRRPTQPFACAVLASVLFTLFINSI